jgi:Cu(I)/Ag(I) efflux system membrane fusion protein
LFEVVSVANLLLEINLPAAVAGTLSVGDELKVVVAGHSLKSTIGLIQPFTVAGDPFIKVRSYVSDTKHLRVGELITATIMLPPAEGLWLPASAVYDLGRRSVVFIKHGPHFSPVEVQTGVSTDGQIQVTSGVSSTDEVARNAQFLIDNEGFIKTTDQ